MTAWDEGDAEQRRRFEDDLLATAQVALDAHLEGRTEFAEMVPHLVTFALRRHGLVTWWGVVFKARSGGDHDKDLRCRFCKRSLAVCSSIVAVAAAIRANEPHRDLCALQYLAGLKVRR